MSKQATSTNNTATNKAANVPTAKPFSLDQLTKNSRGIYTGNYAGCLAIAVSLVKGTATKTGETTYGYQKFGQLDDKHTFGVNVLADKGTLITAYTGMLNDGTNINVHIKPGQFALFLIDPKKDRGSNSRGTNISVASNGFGLVNINGLKFSLWVNRAAETPAEIAACELKAAESQAYLDKRAEYAARNAGKSVPAAAVPAAVPAVPAAAAAAAAAVPAAGNDIKAMMQAIIQLAKEEGLTHIEAVKLYAEMKTAGLV